MPETITIYEDTDDEVHLPARWIVCPRCEGRGTQDCFPGGMTVGELELAGEEFVEDYVAGRYDIPCEQCKGRTTVTAVDKERCSPDQLDTLQRWEADERDSRAIDAAEARVFGY